MKARYIDWNWSSRSISLPKSEQQQLQTMALEVILAHQNGNVSATVGTRNEEKTTVGIFDPAGRDSTNDPMFTKIKDCIFSRVFDELMLAMEIHFCWNSLTVNNDGTQPEEHDLCPYYLVTVTEFNAVATDVEVLGE